MVADGSLKVDEFKQGVGEIGILEPGGPEVFVGDFFDFGRLFLADDAFLKETLVKTTVEAIGAGEVEVIELAVLKRTVFKAGEIKKYWGKVTGLKTAVLKGG